MNLHEFIILMTLSIGTLGYNMRYTSGYIPKLQIDQHLEDFEVVTRGILILFSFEHNQLLMNTITI